MLGEKDLIFLGVYMLLSNTPGSYITQNEINDSIESSIKIFNKIFSGENSKDKMILD